MKKSTISIIVIVIIIILGLALWYFLSKPNSGNTTNTNEETNSIEIVDFAFSPESTTVAVGTEVTWKNKDSATHNVIAESGPKDFSSPNLAEGQTYNFTFEKSGKYAYYCSFHPAMKGTITVK